MVLHFFSRQLHHLLLCLTMMSLLPLGQIYAKELTVEDGIDTLMMELYRIAKEREESLKADQREESPFGKKLLETEQIVDKLLQEFSQEFSSMMEQYQQKAFVDTKAGIKNPGIGTLYELPSPSSRRKIVAKGEEISREIHMALNQLIPLAKEEGYEHFVSAAYAFQKNELALHDKLVETIKSGTDAEDVYRNIMRIMYHDSVLLFYRAELHSLGIMEKDGLYELYERFKIAPLQE